MRTTFQHTLQNPKQFKEKLLFWSKHFREAIYLDSNNYDQKYSSFDVLVAVDAFTSIETNTSNNFEELHQYQQINKDYLFGYLSYDLKNEIENLSSDNSDGLHFPDLFFFQPKKIFTIVGNQLTAEYLRLCDDEFEDDLIEIENEVLFSEIQQKIEIIQRVSEEDYVQRVQKMQSYIQRGDIYEANFCMDFFAENAVINPVETFSILLKISEPPFSAFLKNNKHYILSASPERYLRKEGSKIISQPIKGTARRDSDSTKDERIKIELSQNEKERSENIMIVDLVRNDLSKTATRGSVSVEELCGVYSFKQVHHLISTVVSEIKNSTSPVEVIKTTFPMGSMTGAPKVSAMKIIEELEATKRGVYSGAIGYFTPSGDFDFNVVIRSILYNSSEKYVSFSVGSAITSLSDPKKEYEECLLKAKAMRQVLEN